MDMKLRYKIWLERGGKAFGDGPWDILRRVDRLGSLRQAAAEINMSYSQAWALVRMLEKRLGFPLLEKRVGGRNGGGSVLTPEARELVFKYGIFRERADRALQSLYEEVFGGS